MLASPADADDGVGAPRRSTCGATTCCRRPTDEKVALALELEAAVRAADPRVRGVESASYGDAAVEAAVANSLGVEASTRRTTCSCSAFAMAGEGTVTQTGYGFSAGRSFAELDVARRGRATPPSAPCGCSAPRRSRRRRLPVVLDPLVTRSVLALLGGALSGEAMVKGRSLFVGPRGRDGRGPGHHAGRRPDAAPRRSAPRPTTPRACRPVGSSSSPAAASTASCTTCTPAGAPGARHDGLGGARRLQVAARRRRACAAPRARCARRRGDPGVGRPRRSTCSR